MNREKITTEHSAESWNEEVEKYKKGEKIDIYARNRYPELEKKEKEFAKMIKVPDTALFNAGMAAIYTAIEAENLKPGDVVLCGKDVYSQTKEMYNSLEKRGIKIELINSGDMDEIEENIKSKKPRLIILEDIANAHDMQVCDIKKLAGLTEQANGIYQSELSPDNLLEQYFSKREQYKDASPEFKENATTKIQEFKQGNNPFVFRDIIKEVEDTADLSTKDAIREVSRMVKFVLRNSREKLSLIIDNTLASPILYNPIKDLEGSDVEAVVVESGTKHYQEGQDKITLGIAYSNRQGKIDAIKKKRTELGTYLQPVAEKEIPQDITETMPDILKQHADNALRLAEMLSKSKNIIAVSHPNLPAHKQNELVKEIAPEGLVSLFYIKVPDAEEFVKKVKELGGDKIGVGGSFGHKKTWLYNIGDQIRIAAGSEKGVEFEETLDIFRKAMEKTD
ncbi:PLP-dependent transferase [Patescibacteria group bacterium]|nr:PLP-dependent transferase [Patescibacteria group bacterium]MBU4027196.1 PLP-dependent transferase [Patescibacteria group bacterium]MBU4073375.1 PLP-dependent transferase [Patescibacteria group bacterium]MBU4102982.1 PLP-dependent transferase [Patescibacteria group bacterium]MBU4125032.1 PLP-dependent transferase [Patescibacteria group bacterium]